MWYIWFHFMSKKNERYCMLNEVNSQNTYLQKISNEKETLLLDWVLVVRHCCWRLIWNLFNIGAICCLSAYHNQQWKGRKNITCFPFSNRLLSHPFLPPYTLPIFFCSFSTQQYIHKKLWTAYINNIVCVPKTNVMRVVFIVLTQRRLVGSHS